MKYEDFKALNIKVGTPIFIGTGMGFINLKYRDIGIWLIIIGILWFFILDIVLLYQIRRGH